MSFLKIFLSACCLLTLFACGTDESAKPATKSETEAKMPDKAPEVNNSRYLVKRITEDVPVDAKWDKMPWQRVQPGLLANNMGHSPAAFSQN